MKLKLQLTFRILFFYSVMFIVGMSLMVYKSFLSMIKRMRMELSVVWSHREKIKAFEQEVTR